MVSVQACGWADEALARGRDQLYADVPLALARELAEQAKGKLAAGADLTAEKKARRTAARGGRFPFRDVLERVLNGMRAKGRADKHVAERKRIGDALLAAGLTDLGDPRACGIAEAWINRQECSNLTKHRYGMHTRALGRAALKCLDDLPRDPFRALDVGSATIPAPAMFTLDELCALAGDDAASTPWGRLIRFLLYTGCRMREGMYARWSRIDLDHATFAVLPPTEAEREAGEAVKRNRGRTVVLQPELVDILRSMPHAHGDFLFTDQCRGAEGSTTVYFRDHLTRLGIPVNGRHIHTLRHAHVTLSVACGVPDMQLRLSVGHGGPAMTAHYGNAAMLWRGKLAQWHGIFKLRDPVEAKRLNIQVRDGGCQHVAG